MWSSPSPVGAAGRALASLSGGAWSGGGGGGAIGPAPAPEDANTGRVASALSPWSTTAGWHDSDGEPLPFTWSWRNCDCLEGTLIDEACGDGGVITREYSWTLSGSECEARYYCREGNACACHEAGGSSDAAYWSGSEPRGWCERVTGFNDPSAECANVACTYTGSQCECTYTCGHKKDGVCSDDGNAVFYRAPCAVWESEELRDKKEACWGPFNPTKLTDWAKQTKKDLAKLADDSAKEAQAAEAAWERFQEMTTADREDLPVPVLGTSRKKCSCSIRDTYTSGGRSCGEMHKSGECPEHFEGDPNESFDQASCQASARRHAPPHCQGCLGHCLYKG